jgi:hypothetical protein
LILGAGLLVARPAHAQIEAPGPDQEGYVNPGWAAMRSNDFGNSFTLDAGYLRHLYPMAWLGVEAGYLWGSKFEGINGGQFAAATSVQSFGSDTQARILHVAPEIKLGPRFGNEARQFQPYIAGGGGFYWTHLNHGSAALADGASVAVPAADNFNGGWNLGGGASFCFKDRCIGVDVRRQEIVYRHAPDIAWVAPALRLSLQF